MPSPITQSLGPALAQLAHAQQSPSRPDAVATATPADLIQASRIAGQIATVKATADEQRSPEVPKKTEGSYAAHARKKKEKDGDSESAEKDPGEETLSDSIKLNSKDKINVVA